MEQSDKMVSTDGSSDGSGNAVPAEGMTEKRGPLAKILRFALMAGLVSLIVSGWWAYRRWQDMKEMAESVRKITETFESMPIRYLSVPENRNFTSTAAVTGLSLVPYFPGGDIPAEPAGMPAGTKQAANRILGKYGGHPLVREFMKDLEADPSLKKAMSGASSGNPMKMIGKIGQMKDMMKLVEKYAARPDFMPFIMEVMNDPEVKALMESSPMGRMLKAGLPGGVSLPDQSAVSPVQNPVYPGASREGQSMSVDPSRIQALSAEQEEATIRKKAPPPLIP
ncbi:MAG: hypothetical protein ABIG11_04085 [bacterium]